jgi:hypothetical protein
MTIEQFASKFKSVWAVGALVLGQLFAVAMVAGEYKARIGGLEEKVGSIQHESKELREEMQQLRVAITRLTVLLEKGEPYGTRRR